MRAVDWPISLHLKVMHLPAFIFCWPSMSHGRRSHRGAGKYQPTLCPEETGQCLVTSTDHCPPSLSSPRSWQMCLEPSGGPAHLGQIASPGALDLHQVPSHLPSPFTSLRLTLPTLPTLTDDLPKLIQELYRRNTTLHR